MNTEMYKLGYNHGLNNLDKVHPYSDEYVAGYTDGLIDSINKRLENT